MTEIILALLVVALTYLNYRFIRLVNKDFKILYEITDELYKIQSSQLKDVEYLFKKLGKEESEEDK